MAEESAVRTGVAAFWGAEALAHVLSWPDENLVRFLGTRFSDRAGNAKRRAVEIGCGNGRNLFALERQGFETLGVDISDDAASNCRAILSAAGMKARVLTGAFQDVLTPVEPFDLIVWDSPFIDTEAGMADGFARARALLKPGGMLWVKFRHPESWFAGLGAPHGGGTYLLDDRAGPYAGALYSFHDRAAGEAMLTAAGFAISNAERVELWKKNETERHVWTVFWAEAG
ncbi:MAG: class I SAM-dependent methyltransferase [Glycocaulis sp.]